MLMQHVSAYNRHRQTKLRTVNALQGCCVHLGSDMAYSVFAVGFIFFIHKVPPTESYKAEGQQSTISFAQATYLTLLIIA